MSPFTESVTTMVPKKVNKISCFDHIRPISLCNADIYYTQIGYRPKRRLHEHVFLLDLLMKRHLKYTFLWIDFSKAFDSISHNFLFSLLQHLEFINKTLDQ
eukprot:TRINITY_DN11759_c0_g1_i2.p1 TRINITY_DN11759_c0_g1~~TRINITY_DN11759_c0_g1_i2.p1  ORF type:complete len:101 (-),score=5.14 TRINITY_DN11759_c0_g1_i2:39-341(-)